MSQSYYVVVDLEATCTNIGEFSRYEMETIEVGAVLCDRQTLQPIREFQTFIQPIRHPKLTAFCTELTTITQAQVANAPLFPVAMRLLAEWIDNPYSIFCSWGNYDWKQLQQDAGYHQTSLPPFAKRINLKEEFAQQTKTKKRGMNCALNAAQIPLVGTHHRGIDDARNIAKLLPYALGKLTLDLSAQSNSNTKGVRDDLWPRDREKKRGRAKP